MSLPGTTNNIFYISGRHYKGSYNAANVTKTKEQLNKHFNSDSYHKIAPIMANEIDVYYSPAAQNMVDIYHQSKQTWSDFTNNTTLSHLRKNNINIFCQLQDYQYHYTSNIYAPLSQLTGRKFKGDANNIVMKLSDVYNHLKLRKTAPNCCLQVDVRLTPSIQSRSKWPQIHQYTDVSTDDDDDEYALEYTKNLEPIYNITPKGSSTTSNIAKHAKMETIDLARENIDGVMRRCMDPLDTKPYTYKRYEMLFDLKPNMVTTFAAISNNTLPRCSFINSPLCRIWNSTNSTPEIINHLAPNRTDTNLLTFSYHLLNDCIQIYMYVSSDGRLYGSRVFKEDLFTTIPGLFEIKRIDKHTKEELDTYLEFKDDKIYDEYKQVLFEHDSGDLHQNIYELSDKMSAQLVEFVYSWNDKNGRLFQIDLEQITEIFIKNKINYAYFEIIHRTKFVKLLQRNGVRTCIANELWLVFGGHLCDNSDCKSCMEEKSENQSICTDSTDVTILFAPSQIQNHQIQLLQKQIQALNIQLIQKDKQLHDVVVEKNNIISNYQQKNSQLRQRIDTLTNTISINNQSSSDTDHSNNGSIDADDNSAFLDEQMSSNNVYNFMSDNTNNGTSVNQNDTNSSSESDSKQHEEHNISDDSDDEDIYDDQDDNKQAEDIISWSRPLQPEYGKWDITFSDAAQRYYHLSILPERRRRLEGIRSRNEEMMRTNQVHLDTQIIRSIFQIAMEAYYVIWIYLISNAGFRNFSVISRYSRIIIACIN